MEDATRRLVFLASASVVTAILLAAVLSLGSWAYHTRRLTLHAGRVGRLLEKAPAASDVTAGLLAEPGNRLIGVVRSAAELRRLPVSLPPARLEEIDRKLAQWPDLRVFGVGEMAYFLYFDRTGKLRDYVVFADQTRAR
jgi:hypothetical protein